MNETTMSTQGKMEETIDFRPITGKWSIVRDDILVAEFAHESDANRFVAGEKAIEALNKCKAFIREVATDQYERASPGLKVSAMDLLVALSQLPSDDKAGTQ